MVDLLNKAKDSPEGVRRNIAIALALLVTILIGLIWIVSSPSRYNIDNSDYVAKGVTDDDRSPFDMIGAQVGDFVDAVSVGLDEVKGSINETE